MRAYYNDNDPGCCAWLRELMKAGLIPEGDIDDRSIIEVKPSDLRGYTQVHLFAGIGGWPYALRLAGWPSDRYVWTASFPCQPVSGAGVRKGEKDERHLWPVGAELISECGPTVIFGEQVASKDGREWFSGIRADLEAMGYAVGGADLCAAGLGAPNIRQRIFWVADSMCCGTEYGPGKSLGEETEIDCRNGSISGERLRSGVESAAGWLANANEFGEIRDKSSNGERRWIEQDGINSVVWMEKPDNRVGDRRLLQRPREDTGENQGGASPFSEGPGVVVGLADLQGKRCGEEGDISDRPQKRPSDGIAVGHPANCECQGSEGGVSRREDAEREIINGYLGCNGAAGFWDRFDLVPCRDGKYRRVEPGAFPLADGFPERVGLLRGYGNAINPYPAATFIMSFKEISGYKGD